MLIAQNGHEGTIILYKYNLTKLIRSIELVTAKKNCSQKQWIQILFTVTVITI